MLSVYAALWAFLLLAFVKSNDDTIQRYLSALHILQLGFLSVVVYMFTIAVETNVLNAVFTVVKQMLQGKQSCHWHHIFGMYRELS